MRKKYSIAALAMVLVAGLAGGAVFGTSFHGTRSEAARAETNAPVRSGLIDDLNNTFTQVAHDANESVVTIFSDRVVKNNAGPLAQSPFGGAFGDEFFRRFFGAPNQRGGTKQHLHGMGSGVIVDASGYILTNNHVVQGADQLEVMLPGGHRAKAKLIGADKRTDIAVIRVHADNLTPMRMGDSDKLKTGEWVLAIGSPLSDRLAHTVTSGIVSATGRDLVGLADYQDYIQTDAAINPGNSGGALINLHGELVGINAAIATQTGGYQGIGFAVPINLARSVMHQLMTNGKVVRGWLGIYIQNINSAMATAMKLKSTAGVLVSDVVSDGPAASAGLKSGDVITGLDGKPVENSASFRLKVANRKPKSSVELSVLRGDKKKKIRVKLGELPGENGAVASAGGTSTDLGFAVHALDAQLADRLGLSPDDEGVVVMRVEDGGAAARAGLRPGDLITRVGRKTVASRNDFKAAIKGLKKGDTVLLHVKRNHHRFFLAFELEG